MRKLKAPAGSTSAPRRPGRPRSMAPRATSVRVRFTALELRAVDAKAAAAGLPRATFLRRAALVRRINAPRVPAIHLRAVFELLRLGNNLNQAVKLVHQGRLSPDLESSIARLQETIDRYRDELTNASSAPKSPSIGGPEEAPTTADDLSFER